MTAAARNSLRLCLSRTLARAHTRRDLTRRRLGERASARRLEQRLARRGPRPQLRIGEKRGEEREGGAGRGW